MYNTVIFDLDGTVLDGSEGIISALRQMIKVQNYEMPKEDVLKSFIGPPLEKSFKDVFKLSDDDIKISISLFRSIYGANLQNTTKIYSNMLELFDFLKKNGIKLGIATYKPQNFTDKLIQQFNLGKYFDSICGADNNNKLTKKDILLTCINKMDASSKDCIFIGDSLSDAKAADKLGVKFIGVTYGFGLKPDDQLDFNYIKIANNTNDLLKYFKNLEKE